jgi:peptide chain release factor subunit 1
MSGKIEKHGASTIDSYKVKRDLAMLKKLKGFHTELISLYIPPERPISMVMNYLRNEVSESSNIKSKTTRKNVTDAITGLMATLKVQSNTENGLILFDGFIPVKGPGTEKEFSAVIIPPEPVPFFKYNCGAEFLLEPLEDMIKDKSTIGLVSISRNETAIGWLRGMKVEIVSTIQSGIHGKHSAGGQSQHRYERLIEEAAHEFYKRCAEHAEKVFDEIPDLTGIIVGGPGLTKNEWLEGPYLRDEYKRKVLQPLLDTDGGGETGVRTLLFKAQDILRDTEFVKQKKIFDRFMDNVARDTGMIIYGINETLDALKNAAVEQLLLSEKLGRTHIVRTCNGCGKEDHFFVKTPDAQDKIDSLKTGECPDCNAGYVGAKVKSEDLIEYLGELANQSGTDVLIMSADFEEGATYLKTFGGVGGFLRYKYQGNQ